MRGPRYGRLRLVPPPLSVSVAVTIERPRDEVYALLDDLPAHERFTDHFLVDWEVRGDAARFRVKGTGRHDRMEISAVESTPRRIVEEGRAGKDMRRRTRGTYELRSLGPDRTEVTFISEVLEPASRLEPLGNPLAKAYLRRMNGKAMARLKALLET